jgi:hypothetical protein
MRLPFTSKKSLTLILASLLALFSISALLLFSRLQDEKALVRRAHAATSSGMYAFPKLILWAWERPEQMDFINPREVGVAFLAQTIYLREERVIKRLRMQPLKVPQGTTLIAVVRIETLRDSPPALSNTQRAKVVEALLEAATAPNVSALQIDFDALVSERGFYKSLLQDVRARLPQSMPLSMTALASWCIDDNWLSELPVDEAVPMLFRMGLDERRIKNFLKGGGEFRSALCRLSRGISTDEPVQTVSKGARTYVFNTEAWTKDSVQSAIERNSK